MTSDSVWTSTTGTPGRCGRSSASRRSRLPDPGGLAGTDQRQPASTQLCTKNPSKPSWLDAVVVGDERERRLRLARGDDSLRPRPAMPAPERTPARPAYRCRTKSRLRAARATRSVRSIAFRPCPAASRPGTSTRTSTGPPSTPIRCAETPTHASPRRRISSCVVDHSGSASTPPLTFSHSTTTVPLKRAGHSGAARGHVSGTAQCRPANDQRPSSASGLGRRVRRRRSRCDVFVLHVPGPLEVHGDRVAEEDTVAAGRSRSRRTVRPGGRVVSPAPAEVLEPPTAAISRATAPATASAAGLGNGCELQVERAAAEDVGRQVLVAAGARRTVLGLGDRDVRHAVEEAFDAGAGLGAGERRAGRVWAPCPNARCWRALVRSTSNSAGSSKWRGSRFAGAVEHHHGRPRGCRRHPPSWGRVTAGSRPSPGSRTGGSPRRSSGCWSRSSRRSCCRSGRSPIRWARHPRPDCGLLAGGEQVGGDTHVGHVGRRPVGNVAVARPVSTSPRGHAGDPRCIR